MEQLVRSLLAPAAIAAIISATITLVGSLLTYFATHRRLRREYQLEYAAERIAHQLLNHPEWEWRSFERIKHHLGGFADDELRKILVRAGAIRTYTAGNAEMWSLLKRNPNVLPPASEPQL